MGERTEFKPGTFCWVDLGTPDLDSAKAFYSGLFGWEPEDIDTGDAGIYSIMRIDGRDAAAVFEQPKERREAGVPPAWDSYISVDDADATAERVKELGGNVIMEPFDVMGDLGRMTYVQDPQGAYVAIWQPKAQIGAGVVNTPGSLTLNQLNTSDPEAAGGFYRELLGWSVERQTEDALPPYWGLFNDRALNGGMMQLPDNEAAVPPHWLAYFGSGDLDASAKQVGELGGQVVVPPIVIPGGRFAVAQDPQGAFFAMFEGRFDD